MTISFAIIWGTPVLLEFGLWLVGRTEDGRRIFREYRVTKPQAKLISCAQFGSPFLAGIILGFVLLRLQEDRAVQSRAGLSNWDSSE